MKAIRIDFAESEHLVLRQVAARLGIPVRHYCHKALLATATSDLDAPPPPQPQEAAHQAREDA